MFNSLSHHGITRRTDQKNPAQKTQHEMPLDATQPETATAETEQIKTRKKGIKTEDEFDFHKQKKKNQQGVSDTKTQGYTSFFHNICWFFHENTAQG